MSEPVVKVIGPNDEVRFIRNWMENEEWREDVVVIPSIGPKEQLKVTHRPCGWWGCAPDIPTIGMMEQIHLSDHCPVTKERERAKSK